MLILGYAHATLMIAAFIGLLLGFVVARCMKKSPRWFKVHRSIGITGAIFVLIGFGAVALQITFTGRSHFRIPHSYLGMLVVLLTVTTPVLGMMMTTTRNRAAKLRNYHRWSGRITLFLMLVNVVAGLTLIGIL